MMTSCLSFLLIATPILIWIIIFNIHEQRRFNKAFPPISDDEFLARCTTGTNPQVALKVRRIVSDSLGIPYERIYPSASFMSDFGVD